MSKKFNEMTKAEQDAALTETFAAMLGEESCETHDTPCVGEKDGFGNILYYCPVCMAENAEADKRRIAAMNKSIAFADWHARTDA